MSQIDQRNFTNTAASKQGRVVMSGIIARKLLIKQKNNLAGGEPLYPNAPMDDNLIGVMPGEVLISRNDDVLSDANFGTRKTLGNKRRKTRIQDPDPEVISKVNGVAINSYMASNFSNSAINRADLTDEEKMNINFMSNKDIVRRSFRYTGISNTAYQFDSKNKDLQKTGIAIQIGGTVSIINTGDEKIRQFEKVCWDLPPVNHVNEKSYAGIDKRSLAVHTVPFDVANTVTWYNVVKHIASFKRAHPEGSFAIGDNCEAFCKNIIAATNGTPAAIGEGDTEEQVEEKLKPFKSLFFTMGCAHTEQRDRVIGVALSPASSKEQFDIWLGNHH